LESIILFAHGARDPAWAGPLERLQAAVRLQAPDLDVRLAFLELMQPTLPEAIDAAVLDGARQISVVPVFLAQGGHVKREVPVLMQTARDRHPGVKITLQEALGETQRVIDAMAVSVILQKGQTSQNG
jgi:sirohydrochlorin cobaltochelatase